MHPMPLLPHNPLFFAWKVFELVITTFTMGPRYFLWCLSIIRGTRYMAISGISSQPICSASCIGSPNLPVSPRLWLLQCRILWSRLGSSVFLFKFPDSLSAYNVWRWLIFCYHQRKKFGDPEKWLFLSELLISVSCL